MKRTIGLLIIAFFVTLTNLNAQDQKETGTDTESLGLPGDNLDLYATLDLFQQSKTIEDFEASLNDDKSGINNLDLNVDGDVDFIKVITKKDGDDFTFVLQVDVLEKETQDVAVILVSKKEDKVTIQMVGDEDLYGKDYVLEPKSEAPAVTANPAYSGTDTVVVKSEPATVVVVESEPIIMYMYSPVYAPYYPPYYYGYYPPYYHPYPVVTFNVYYGRHHHHHNHYHGGHHGGNTVVIHNNNNYNNYNRTRNTSNTVNRNKNEGNYNRNSVSKQPSTKPSTRPATKPNAKPATKPATKPSAKPASKPAAKPSAKPSSRPSSRPASRPTSRPRGGKRR